MLARVIAAALLGVVMAAVPTEGAPPLSLVPRPVTVVQHEGTFTLTADTAVAGGGSDGRLLAEQLRPATGLPLAVVEGATGRPAVRLERMATNHLEVEGTYTLDVTPAGVVIRSTSDAGLFYGGQTLRQLLPPAVFSKVVVPGVTWAVPCVHIEDQPRYAWRGQHLDCARHFFPVEFVKQTIDVAAAHKLNRFHWHLTDDQGWRLEIKKYPRLTEVGSKRAGTMVPDPADPKHLIFDRVPYGGFYTQDQVRDVVAYAAARHVMVVPEIEMPGHSAAAIAAYPHLGVATVPVAVRTGWGVEDHILNPSPATVAFYHDVLAEVMDLFPSPYIHCGGDEVPKGEWKASPAVQAQIRALGLKDDEALQGWFMGQMDRYLAAHGRRMIGWDEILDGGLSPGATVMSWRGAAGAVTAARQRHAAINADSGFVYLDHYQSKDTPHEPRAIGGYLPLAKVYAFDPTPPGLSAEQAKLILGGQAQLWSEYIPTPRQAAYMLYPRSFALAEAVWSPADGKDLAAFERRVAVDLQRLAAMGVTYRSLDGR